MDSGRLEAMSDGVIAIIITIMVLEMSAPVGAGFSDLLSMAPGFISYAIFFVLVGIYWNNHHHLLNLVQHVNGRLLWSNLLFLFVLSLVPVATDWVDKTSFAALPTTTYVALNLLVSLTYMNVQRVIAKNNIKKNSELFERLQSVDLTKERWTIALSLLALVFSMVLPTSHLAFLPLIGAYALWIVPDLRIVHALDHLCSEDD